MVWQIVWLVLQLIILGVVTVGTRVQVRRGDISVLAAAGTVMGTLAYCFINNLILVFGGFFNCFF